MAFNFEDQDSSTNRSKPSRLPSLKAFSSIFNRTNRSDVNSRFASPSLSCALGHSGSPPTSLFDHVPFAMHLRHKSNKREPAQREELVDPIQQSFMCGICLEEMPDDFIARPDPCGHTFCRECLRGYLTVRLEEHKFPILCPTCTVGKGKGKGVAGGTCREHGQLACDCLTLFLRGLAVPCPRPRTQRRTIRHLD